MRSIHEITSERFVDHAPIWPLKNGSPFQFRVRISDPITAGRVEVGSFSEEISFMRSKTWGGTLQGANGVFNARPTARDFKVFTTALEQDLTLHGAESMAPAPHPLR